MGDMGEYWRDHREYIRNRRMSNLERAEIEAQKERDSERLKDAANKAVGWKVHTMYHWSKTVCGKRLDYWPSRNKWQYDGKISTGNVKGFIKNREREAAKNAQI